MQRALAAGPPPAKRWCSPRRPTAQAGRPAGAAAARAGDRRSRSVPRLGLRPGRAQRPVPVRERQEVQVLSRAVADAATVRDLEPRSGRRSAGGWTRRRTTCASTTLRAGMAELETELGATRPLGRHGGRSAGDPRVRPDQRRRRSARHAAGPGLRRRDALPAGRGGGRRLGGSRAGGHGRRQSAADARRPGAALAVHRRARRARRGLRDPRQGRRHRRPGLGRDDGAHVPALGRAAGLRPRDRGRQRGPGSRHPVGHLHHPRSLRHRTADLRAGGAPPGADLARSTPRPAARPASPR